MTLLTASNIVKSYARSGQADTVVLQGVSCSIDAGEFVALVGPSGAGKSTLLHILASLDVPDSGTVQLTTSAGTVNYVQRSQRELAAMRNTSIGVVYQFHHLLPEFTALENVMMPALISGASTTQARTKAERLLDRVGIAARAEHMPSELSGGEQQRVAIARALMNEPAVLFADEPTGNLDSANATAIVDLLCELQTSTNMACVVATHSTEVAQRAHRIIHMRDGNIV
ncbi:MAG: ABC transporter ATP-binding protein [Bacteroidetes bacterium]|nr:ABC transporter ATP-binding protein [Bacteroidota bacterium]